MGALINMMSSERSVQDKNPAYAGLYSSVKILENDKVIPQGTITKDMTIPAAKQALNRALSAYYGRLMQVVPNYRNTLDFNSPGANILSTVAHQAANGLTSSPTLNSILAPTQAVSGVSQPTDQPTSADTTGDANNAAKVAAYQQAVKQLTTPPSPVYYTAP